MRSTTTNLLVRFARSNPITTTSRTAFTSNSCFSTQAATTAQHADEMKEKIKHQQQQGPSLRFDYTGLEMSDKVRQLLDLTNGSKREVVKAQKQQGMKLFQMREGDTGSSAVQVIAITTRIQQMQSHLATHRKDQSGKRALQRLYVRRRKLLDYMERKEFDSYRHVVKTLGLVRS